MTDSETGSRFWVFTYVIANKTGKSQRFSPRFELLMGDGTVLEAGRDVPVDAARRMQSAAAGPRALDQLFLSAARATEESAFTLSAVVTREGRLVNVEWHSQNGRAPRRGSREAEAVDTLLNTASLARFEPARMAGLPVAVNVVWLVANTTVRAPKTTLDLPVTGASATDGASMPTPRKRRVDVVVPDTRPSSIA